MIREEIKQQLLAQHFKKGKSGIRLTKVIKAELEIIHIPGFETVLEKAWAIVHNTFIKGRCQTCGTELPFKSYDIGFVNFCSPICSARHPDTRQKCKDTCVEKFGVENPYQLEHIRSKIGQDRFERTGEYHQMHLPATLEKMKANAIQNYGVEHQMQRQEVKNKVASTNLVRYGSSAGFNGNEGKRIRRENVWIKRLDCLKDIVRFLPNQLQEDFDQKYKWECVKCDHHFTSSLGDGKVPICRKCYPVRKNYSSMAIGWLSSLMEADKIFIQHALNIGEYRIPDSKYYVDGFCKETNTVYEFHGDAYHGNLTRYSTETLCHPFDKSITAKDLFLRTQAREQEIKNLGYNLIVMWESEWKQCTNRM